MIIELTYQQLQAARQWGSARHKQYLTEQRTFVSKNTHAVAIPAIGWRTLADRLYAKAYHPSGRAAQTKMKREGTPAARSALQAIERGLAHAQAHPAMRGEAVEGDSAEILVAWRGDEHWSIYPVRGERLTVLVPETRTRRFGEFTMKVTAWEPQPNFSVDIPGLFLADADHAGWVEAETVAANSA